MYLQHGKPFSLTLDLGVHLVLFFIVAYKLFPYKINPRLILLLTATSLFIIATADIILTYYFVLRDVPMVVEEPAHLSKALRHLKMKWALLVTNKYVLFAHYFLRLNLFSARLRMFSWSINFRLLSLVHPDIRLDFQVLLDMGTQQIHRCSSHRYPPCRNRYRIAQLAARRANTPSSFRLFHISETG
jgi:hypothetical protein